MIRLATFFVLFLSLYQFSAHGTVSPEAAAVKNSEYPRLKSTPQISYQQNSDNPNKYDITVSVEADGPDGVHSINLWIQSQHHQHVFASLDLEYQGQGIWQATTDSAFPMPAGEYYVDSIMVEDADSLASRLVKSSWYLLVDPASTNYAVKRRETDWHTISHIHNEADGASIPVVAFSLPTS